MDPKYALFVFERSTVGGGWNDYKGIFSTLEDAKAFLTLLTVIWDEAHVVDLETQTVVASY